MKRILSIVMAVTLVLVGCGKKTEEEVGAELKGISLNKKSLSMDIGETARLMVVYSPESAAKYAPEVTWESSVPSVATVQDGKVTAKQKGKATITAFCGKYYADCEVIVETGGGSGGGGGGGDTQKFEITPTTIEDAGTGGNYTISVTSNRVWSATCEKSWATISPDNGNGDATVTVTVEANTEKTDDEQTITFTSGALKKTVTVKRAGHHEIVPISIDIKTKKMSVDGGSFDVKVSSEAAWNVTCEKSWVTFSDKTDEGVTVNVGPNVSELNWRPDEWMKIPVVFSNGTKSDTLEIRQDIPYVKISPDKFYTFDALKFETKVTSNISWRLEFSYDDKVSGAEGVKNYMHAQPATGTGNETIQVTISKVHSDDQPHSGHGSVWAYGTGTWSGLSVSVGSHGYYSSDFKE